MPFYYDFEQPIESLDEDVEKLKKEPNVKSFFQKPVNVKELSLKVHEVLGTTPKNKAA